MTYPTSNRKERPPHPFTAASFLSKLLFIWPRSLMNTPSTLQDTDLPDVLPADSSEVNLEKFNKMWDEEKERATRVMKRYRHNNKKIPKAAYPSLRRALTRDFFRTLWFIQPIMFMASACRLVQAVALGYLLQSFEVGDFKGGYLWAGVMVGSGTVVLMEHHHVFFWTWRRGYVT